MTELRTGGETWRNIHTMVRNFLREGDIFPEENSSHYVRQLDVVVYFESWGHEVAIEDKSFIKLPAYWSFLRIEPKKKKGWKIYITTQNYKDLNNRSFLNAMEEMHILGRNKEFDKWWAMARLAGYWENRDELEIETL